jgi:hypothetical protein
MEYLNIGLHHLHNVLRWAVLITGAIAIIRAYKGVSAKTPFEAKDNKAGLWFVMSCHTQLLIGLILYFYLGQQGIFSNMAEGMKNPEARYWGVEHFLGMLIAIILVQVGRTLSKKGANDLQKHKRSLIWYSIGLLIILLNIPWPWRETIGRGLFPGM